MTQNEPVPAQPVESTEVNPPVNIQVNQVTQFIQLVNQNNRFPDASTLQNYDEVTRTWILRRTEVEQEHRHQTISQLVTQDYELNKLNANLTSRNQIASQVGATIFIVIMTSIFGILLFHGKEVSAFLSLIPMLGAVATGLYYNSKQAKQNAPSLPAQNSASNPKT